VTKLKISADLSLPRDAVTQIAVVYGGRSTGKSNFGRVFAEELNRSSLRFCFLDPVGSSWGLRYGKTKSEPGLDILILGGTHGDIEIDPRAGRVVAELVADEDISTLVDYSRSKSGKVWSQAEKLRFVTEFAERLYERQSERRVPLNLIVDEAARCCPQTLRSGDVEGAKALGAMSVIAEEGRHAAIGMTLITQRSARLAKSVAELADVMFAFRTLGPNSVAAVLDWLGDHAPKDRHRAIEEQLRKLPIGSALLVSPGWLDHEGVVRIRESQTFDSSETPKPGTAPRRPGAARKPDLAKYQARMAETIERAKADDPKTLKQRIAELERHASAKPKAAAAPAKPLPAERVEVPVFDAERFEGLVTFVTERLQASSEAVATAQTQVNQARGDVGRRLAAYRSESMAAAKAAARERPKALPAAIQLRPPPGMPKARAARVANSEGSTMPKAERKILTAVAQSNGASKAKVALLVGLNAKGGYFNNTLGSLRSKGWLSGFDELQVTEAGLGELGAFDPLPTGSDLLQHWCGEIGAAGAAILKALAGTAERTLSKAALAEATGYDAAGGYYNNTLGKLRTLGLISGFGELTLSPDLGD
jgi:uncharacterized protein